MAEMPERIWALPRSKRWLPVPDTAPPQQIATTYIRADLVDDAVKALEEARAALSVFAAFSDKAERFADHKVKFGGAAIFPVKDFRLSHFRRAVEVIALIDAVLPDDAP